MKDGNKKEKWIIAGLGAAALLLFLLIVLPVFSGMADLEPGDRGGSAAAFGESPVSGGAVTGGGVAETGTPGGISGGALKAPQDRPQEPIFDLKYEKYLIAAPYTYEAAGEAREFQFEKMLRAIEKTDQEYEKGPLTYIDNYKNLNGWAPHYHGGSKDAAGNNRSAAAPGYPDMADLEEFTYLEDGTLVRVLYEDEEYAKVELVKNGAIYFVPQHYVPTDDCLTALNKVIVVDRKNQNIASFEKRDYPMENGFVDENWVTVSYSLATTGKEGKYHQPTPLGFFYAVEKKPKFYYVKDGTTELEGSAPYAIRFSAGAYIHGVAVAFKYREDGTRVEGTVEYSKSIGTVPLSHKCVRNYTSHAKFLYDWYVHGETIVIVIE